ncbi:MAG: tRNA lysidine(34) synthetase TilS [Flavobacteriales bacterium]|nr:tRNA lysidine(34) synthetase TilS [Flavobacteriales bacterium]
MINKFIKYCNGIGFKSKSKLLLGLSGGIDSIALFHLLRLSKFTFEVAHCNFNLRKSDSENDEKFVKKLCSKYNIICHVKQFDVGLNSKNEKISIQMSARKLRFDWFEVIRISRKLDYIILGHNKNDHCETILMNLIKGTGINGLTGIKTIKKKIFRPMLETERSEIEKWVLKNEFTYRTDKSNYSNKYLRNYLRNVIVPKLKNINPSLITTLSENSIKIKNSIKNLHFFYDKIKDEILLKKKNSIEVNIKKLKKYPSSSDILYYYLKDYNFTDWNSMFNLINSQNGKILYSEKYKILKHNNKLIINKSKLVKVLPKKIFSKQNYIRTPLKLRFNKININDFCINKSKKIAALDYDKLTFPLTLRKWESGDFIYPLGLKGKKKMSDFFIDNKFSQFEKEKTWLLLSGDQIIWIIGHRIDDRFKIKEKTKNIYIIQLLN